MRILLFFDLPAVTNKDHKEYRHFVKNLKKDGFYSIQESVFVKLSLNQQSVDQTLLSIQKYLPPRGVVMTLSITEKQFSRLNIMLGDFTSDVINSCERIIYL